MLCFLGKEIAAMKKGKFHKSSLQPHLLQKEKSQRSGLLFKATYENNLMHVEFIYCIFSSVDSGK